MTGGPPLSSPLPGAANLMFYQPHLDVQIVLCDNVYLKSCFIYEYNSCSLSV